MNTRRMNIRKEATRSGFGLGAVVAVAISWSLNKSILWAIAHGLFGWAYVLYSVFSHHPLV